jgi:hypothetical protein
MRRYLATLVLVSASAAAGPTPESLARVLIERVIEHEVIRAPVPTVLCVEVDSRDPANELLRALKRPGRNISPSSQCTANEEAKRDLGNFRIFMSVSGFRSTSQDHARGEVDLALYRNGFFTYETLEVQQHSNGRWRVTGIKRYFQS